MAAGPLVATAPKRLARLLGSEMERYSVRYVRREQREFLQLIELGDFYPDDGNFKRRLVRLAAEVEIPITAGQTLVFGMMPCEQDSQPDGSIFAVVTDSHGVWDESPTWACRVASEAERFDLLDARTVRCRNNKFVR